MKAKRVIAVLCLVVMMLGMVSTAFAATKPSVTITSASKNQTVKRGKTAKFVFKLKSGSYKAKSGYARSKFDSFIIKGSVSGKVYSYFEKEFTGNKKLTLTWITEKSFPTGKYVNLYGTFYRKSSYDIWHVSSAGKTNVRLKK